ncbi:MAG: hypothetical protein DLM67_16325 [Candidatus Nephthysia bennettiae]|uniref:DUF3052 domain-containing protein n=1 Tax=Candidatus Nephthysia bennettiae TaxID=3127016 RepID=A0A934K7Z6_9BACT|nr:hypothetical protein [Candidatus Dormibacteraeota bacterium]MBJ7612186.1 hypothetical protein [Candidatus Dormibacteraeota bacterium]PZR91411.1 MAG: hypothetical protein DLM67_16325 [Candidatus Dormibacteraeota bacterium]
MTADLARKLLIRSGARALVINPPDGYLDLLSPLPAGASVAASGEGPFEVVQLFARTRRDLDAGIAQAMSTAGSDGILWVSYPKLASSSASDLSRQAVWEALDGTGWEPVTQVAVDETWSALRIRPSERVGARRP